MESYTSIHKTILRKMLYDIYHFIQAPKYKDINQSNNISQYNIDRRFIQAIEKLDTILDDSILFNSSIDANKAYEIWKRFNTDFDGVVTIEAKKRYGDVIKSTLRLFEYVKTYKSIVKNPQKQNIRTIDMATEQNRLETIKKNRAKIKEDIARLRSSSTGQDKQIQQLEKRLEDLNKEYNEVQKTISSINSDKTSEENIQQRIENAFKELASYTKNIEEERNRIKNEFGIFLWAIPVLFVAFCIIYYVFLYFYMSNYIYVYDWQSYLPFIMAIPIIATLFWICIYQKNRANKISIELSTRLFNIHYIEGLIKMTNTLSKDADVALDRISNTIDVMLENYQKQTATNLLLESDISKIEQKELESNPYWKMMQEIKDLIKTIKK